MRSVVKHRYVKGASGRARAKAHVNYIQNRRGEDREDRKPREFFSDEREKIQGREVKQDIDDMDRSKVVAHKLILSPGLQNIDMQKYTRDVLKEAGKEKGLDLDWRAVIHRNTDHDHAHVIVYGKDKNGREVLFDKEDYKNMRDAGDRYLERHHYYERFLQRDMDRQLEKGYERDRGDNIFEDLIRDLNREGKEPEREPYKAVAWDNEKAIEHLPEREKIERDGETYSKYSKLEDLKELAEKLSKEEIERVPDEQNRKLGQWIWTKEKFGDDHYERKARHKWDKKEKKKEKERDPFEDDREQKKLDKDLKRAFKEMERGEGDVLGKGYRQWVKEQQGRLAPEHASYTSAMEAQRLKDLMDLHPEKKDEIERQLQELKEFELEQRQEHQKGDKWKDFDALLGENWKSPEKELEQGKDRQDASKSEAGSGNLIADRAGQDLAIDQIHAEASGDQAKIEQEKEIDDGFDRGLG